MYWWLLNVKMVTSSPLCRMQIFSSSLKRSLSSYHKNENENNCTTWWICLLKEVILTVLMFFSDPGRRFLSCTAVWDGAGGGEWTHPQRHGLLLWPPLPLCHVWDPGQTHKHTHQKFSLLTQNHNHWHLSFSFVTGWNNLWCSIEDFITAWLEQRKGLDGLLDAMNMPLYRNRLWG